MELELPNGPVKREMVVHEAAVRGGGGGGHGGDMRMRMDVTVRINADMFHCPICFRPFKPPVFQCEGGHLACGSCVVELPWQQCGKCEHGGDFHACPLLDTFVSSASVQCDHHGCGRYVTYHEAGQHRSACPHAPCSCALPGCGFLGPPPALLLHLNALHSVPVHDVPYSKALLLQVQASPEPRHLLRGEEDGRAFLLVAGAHGPGAAVTVSVVCIRAAASPSPRYSVKLWANGPPPPANRKMDTIWADFEATSSTSPGTVALEELTSFLTVPPRYLHGAGASKELPLHVRIDKITS
ncbi:unnamed protein product [Triticum turgidum subsp. durum]|uniref:RING-type E3 ubiquitin transferase n=1 Tax=Triticum turgidum subsp. durum TaxID=4567 RepID=A0A9R0U372_TRITD|nr:unnamed protein product [Triticum turgidum subsp. durum]